jgi:hypothetical protein
VRFEQLVRFVFVQPPSEWIEDNRDPGRSQSGSCVIVAFAEG